MVRYAVGAHDARRESFLGAALVDVSLSLSIATDPSDSVSNIAPTILLFVALPFGLGGAMRKRQQDIATLTLEAAALQARADAAIDAERRRIARELHDVVSHAVTLIAVQAEAGQAVLDTDPVSARRSLAAIGQVGRAALDELARLLAVLDEHSAAAESSLTPSLRSLPKCRPPALVSTSTTAPPRELWIRRRTAAPTGSSRSR